MLILAEVEEFAENEIEQGEEKVNTSSILCFTTMSYYFRTHAFIILKLYKNLFPGKLSF